MPADSGPGRIGRHQGNVDPGDAKKGNEIMKYKHSWYNAKAEYVFEFKKAEKEIDKLQKQLKKASKDKKKGAATKEQIEDIKNSLKQVSAVKKKKTGLQGPFADMEKILDKMEDMKDDGIDPYTGGGKKWKAILKLHSKTLKEIAKGRQKLDKKMLDETKLINASLSYTVFKYTFPPKNMACKVLRNEAATIINDIGKRGSAIEKYLNNCAIKSKYPGAERDKDAPKSITVNV